MTPGLDDVAPFLVGLSGPEVRIPARLAPLVAAALDLLDAEFRSRGLRGDPTIGALSAACRYAGARQVSEVGQSLDADQSEPAGSDHDYIDTAETARRLGVTERTARRWADSGRLRAERIGWAWAIEAESVAKLARGRGAA